MKRRSPRPARPTANRSSCDPGRRRGGHPRRHRQRRPTCSTPSPASRSTPTCCCWPVTSPSAARRTRRGSSSTSWRRVTVPMIAVLGNHDHHDGRPEAVADILGNAGIHVLEGHAVGARPARRTARRRRCQGLRRRVRRRQCERLRRAGDEGLRAAHPHDRQPPARGAWRASTARTATRGWRCCTTARRPTRSRASGSRSIPSWGATCWPRRSTATAPISRSTATPTRAARRAARPVARPVRNVALPVIGAAYRVFALAPSAITRCVPTG